MIKFYWILKTFNEQIIIINLIIHNLLQMIRPQQVLLFGSLTRWQPTLTAGQFSWHTILALKQIHMLQALGSVSNSPCLYFLPLDIHQTV